MQFGTKTQELFVSILIRFLMSNIYEKRKSSRLPFLVLFAFGEWYSSQSEECYCRQVGSGIASQFEVSDGDGKMNFKHILTIRANVCKIISEVI